MTNLTILLLAIANVSHNSGFFLRIVSLYPAILCVYISESFFFLGLREKKNIQIARKHFELQEKKVQFVRKSQLPFFYFLTHVENKIQ